MNFQFHIYPTTEVSNIRGNTWLCRAQAGNQPRQQRLHWLPKFRHYQLHMQTTFAGLISAGHSFGNHCCTAQCAGILTQRAQSATHRCLYLGLTERDINQFVRRAKLAAATCALIKAFREAYH
jgi:hypothetical protein